MTPAQTFTTKPIVNTALMMIAAAAIVLSGCATECPFVSGTPKPVALEGGPLTGGVSVMLPCDVRPKLERKGDSPKTEMFLPLLLFMTYSSQGNELTGDSCFRAPKTKGDVENFGSKPSVAAGVGEGLRRRLLGWKMFDNLQILCPPERSDTGWPVPEAGPAVRRIGTNDKILWQDKTGAIAAADLQFRAENAPVPECSTEWLLRTRIVHMYAGQHRKKAFTYYIIPAGPIIIFGFVSRSKQQPYVANVVLECELYNMTGGPTLAWKKTVRGDATGGINGRRKELLTNAFNNAMADLKAKLSADIPRIRNAIPVAGR